MRDIQAVVLNSYEVLVSHEDHASPVFQIDRNAAGWLLDDYLSKLMVSRIPQTVTRAMKFDHIVVDNLPRSEVQLYLREAVPSYLFGLDQAAVALARAAIELALRERVPYADVNSWLLDKLIEAASRFKLLAPATLQHATDVQHLGNGVLHGSPCNPDDVFDVFVKTRLVLEALYSKAS